METSSFTEQDIQEAKEGEISKEEIFGSSE